MASKQKWVSQIESQTDSIPYGEIVFSVTRTNRHTTKVKAIGTETLRYNDTGQAIVDIVTFLEGLVDSKHSGTVQFQVETKDGEITILGITNTTETKY